jgi:hypothetical protein
MKRLKRTWTPLQKRQVATRQRWCCARCNNLLDHCFEVDHVHALFTGGSNDLSNAKALCACCHRLKTIEDLQAHREEKMRLSLVSRWRAQLGIFFVPSQNGGMVPLSLLSRVVGWDEAETMGRARALGLCVVPRCTFPPALWGRILKTSETVVCDAVVGVEIRRETIKAHQPRVSPAGQSLENAIERFRFCR